MPRVRRADGARRGHDQGSLPRFVPAVQRRSPAPGDSRRGAALGADSRMPRPRRLVASLASLVLLATAGRPRRSPPVRLAAPADCLTNPGCGAGLRDVYGLRRRRRVRPARGRRRGRLRARRRRRRGRGRVLLRPRSRGRTFSRSPTTGTCSARTGSCPSSGARRCARTARVPPARLRRRLRRVRAITTLAAAPAQPAGGRRPPAGGGRRRVRRRATGSAASGGAARPADRRRPPGLPEKRDARAPLRGRPARRRLPRRVRDVGRLPPRGGAALRAGRVQPRDRRTPARCSVPRPAAADRDGSAPPAAARARADRRGAAAPGPGREPQPVRDEPRDGGRARHRAALRPRALLAGRGRD